MQVRAQLWLGPGRQLLRQPTCPHLHQSTPPHPPHTLLRCRFQLNFGSALGGSYSASAVRAWLDPFIRQTLAGMLVWPERLVVPLLPPEVTGPLDDLMLRWDIRELIWQKF